MPITSKAFQIQQKSSPASNNNPEFIGSGGGPGFFSVGNSSALSAYTSWTWACIDKVSEALAGLEWDVTVAGKEERERAPDDYWLRSLLENPNPEFEATSLWSLAARWYSINGNAYLYTPKYGEATPQEIWVLPSNRVTVVPGKSRLVAGYVYYVNGKPFPIDPEEMIHWKNLDPSSDPQTSLYLGRSPINASMDAVQVDLANQRFLARFYENNALPAYVITVPAGQQVTRQAWKVFKDQWTQTFQGSNNAGKWGLLDGGKQIQTLDTSNQIKDAASLDESNRKRVCSVWGVPEMLLTGDYSARAVSENVIAEFHRGTVAPKAKRLGEAITRMARLYDADAMPKVAFQGYEYNDPAQRMAELQALWTMGLPTNRVLLELGYDPVEGGDISLVQGVPIESLSDDGESEPVQERTIEPVRVQTKSIENSPSAQSLDAYYKNYSDIMDDEVDALTPILADLFEALGEDVIAKIKSENTEKDITFTGSLFDLDEWVAMLTEETTPWLTRLFNRVGSQAFSDVNSDISDHRTGFGTRVTEAMSASTSKITTSLGTIKEELTDLLKANRREPVSKVTELIQKRFDHYTKGGAQRIAQTTATYTTGAAQNAAWKTLQADDDSISSIKRVWLTQRDGKVRKTHKKADGQEENKQGKFRVGRATMEHPGGGSKAEEAINCRCVTRPRIKRKR